MKKLLALVLALIMVLGAVSASFAEGEETPIVPEVVQELEPQGEPEPEAEPEPESEPEPEAEPESESEPESEPEPEEEEEEEEVPVVREDGYITDSNGNMAYRYDACGRYNEQTLDVCGLNDGQRIQTTYSNRGLGIIVRIDDQNYVVTDTNENPELMVSQNNTGSWVYNEELGYSEFKPNYVDTGLAVQTTADIIGEEGNVVKVTHTVTNNTDHDITYNLGVGTDVQIGGDDGAPINGITAEASGELTGFTMTSRYDTIDNEGTPASLVFSGRDGIAGDSPNDVDTIWYGKYWNWYESSYMFAEADNTTTYSEGCDSGFTYAWLNRTIGAGLQNVYSVLFGVGDLTAIEEVAEEVQKEIAEEHGITDHEHNWRNGVCTECQEKCEHEWYQPTRVCLKCHMACKHQYYKGFCIFCCKPEPTETDETAAQPAGNEGNEGNEDNEDDKANNGNNSNEGNNGNEGKDGNDGNDGNEGDNGADGKDGNDGTDGNEANEGDEADEEITEEEYQQLSLLDKLNSGLLSVNNNGKKADSKTGSNKNGANGSEGGKNGANDNDGSEGGKNGANGSEGSEGGKNGANGSEGSEGSKNGANGNEVSEGSEGDNDANGSEGSNNGKTAGEGSEGSEGAEGSENGEAADEADADAADEDEADENKSPASKFSSILVDEDYKAIGYIGEDKYEEKGKAVTIISAPDADGKYSKRILYVERVLANMVRNDGYKVLKLDVDGKTISIDSDFLNEILDEDMELEGLSFEYDPATGIIIIQCYTDKGVKEYEGNLYDLILN